jgi:YfiH family protein
MKVHTSSLLSGTPGIAHGFFTRRGGVSTGLYDSLNTGTGSGDDRENVLENRARVARAIGAREVLSLYQVHSAEAVEVTAAWAPGEGPKADGMATRVPGLALGVLAADCTPVLFADAGARVIGACHAGWKGTLANVMEATLRIMEGLGADRANIKAAIGPAIRQKAYEVGAEFRDRFLAEDRDFGQYFAPGARPEKFQFDLTGLVRARLESSGIGHIEDLAVCTYDDPDFFSYRRTTHRSEPDYGRNLSAIVLTP